MLFGNCEEEEKERIGSWSSYYPKFIFEMSILTSMQKSHHLAPLSANANV
jgi:hypothetical protein